MNPTSTNAALADALLVRCHAYLCKEIQRLTLNESAQNGVQSLSRDIAEHLDGLRAALPDPASSATQEERAAACAREAVALINAWRYDVGAQERDVAAIIAKHCFPATPPGQDARARDAS